MQTHPTDNSSVSSAPFFEAGRAWAEIDARALAGNIARLQSRYGGSGTRLMAVVKADAYGHDVRLIVPLCAAAGVRDYGVATALEGTAVRRSAPPESSVYLLGPALVLEAETIARERIVPLVSDLDVGQALSQAAVTLGLTAEVHLDVDTGIGRAGCRLEEAPGLLRALDALPALRVTGLATHFARADEDLDDARAQYALFAGLLGRLGNRAVGLEVHAANSPAALGLGPGVRHHLVRPGLLLYGIEPAPGLFSPDQILLRPVLSLKTRVTLCRPLPPGATISYGRTYRVPAGGGRYATLGIGYGDGFPRRLSGRGYVLLHGRRAPICGRVCMDQVVVDVSGIPQVRAGDVATVVGTDGGEMLTAGALAALIDATPHEITTGLTARVPRRLVGS